MESQRTMLAAMNGFGAVSYCNRCQVVHLQIAAIDIALEPAAYMQLVAMISTSAANFETLLQQRENDPHAAE